MTIRLGLQLANDNCLPVAQRPALNEVFFTPRDLLTWLEGFYGLTPPPGETDFLRTEQYRQCCAQLVAEEPGVFFARSFLADQRATAATLLSLRDELIGTGFPLHRPAKDWPPRLVAIGKMEAWLLDGSFVLLPGVPDRLRRLLAVLVTVQHPPCQIILQEPAALLPPEVNRLLDALKATGSKVSENPSPPLAAPNTDLARWQHRLQKGGSGKIPVAGDSSILILRAARETHIAAYVARILRDNPEWKPSLLLSARNQTLNDALSTEGLPDQGVPVTSLGRPSLQVLKLVTVFLWEPLDLRKIMEFLNLIVKPLDQHLGQYLARLLSDTPGLYGERWFAGVNNYFNEILPNRTAYEKSLDPSIVREQFDQWFNRRRYDRESTAAKSDVRSLFSFLLNWSRDRAEELSGANQTAQLLLAAQAKRVVELIDALPEEELSFLEVDRLVRTVYEPGITRFRETEIGSLPMAFSPSSVWNHVSELIWWDFVERDPNYFFSRWTTTERRFMKDAGIHLLSPSQQNELLVWQWRRPPLYASKRLVLCLPERVDGAEALPHPLLGELEAAFGEEGISELTVDVDENGDGIEKWKAVVAPRYQSVPIQELDGPQPTIRINRAAALAAREEETPTSLDKLLYYPYQWVFRYRSQLRSNDILDVAADNRLRGNLAHRAIEKLLGAKGNGHWDRGQVNAWLNENFEKLLRQEGAIFLEYGREPERVQLLNVLKYAASALVELIQNNHWEVAATEAEVEGQLSGAKVRGRADLLLRRNERETAIVDLKWRGKSVFKSLINNQEDLQLCLYANFVSGEGDTVHTAYFIIRDGLMLGRNDLAFKGVEAISPDLDHESVNHEVLKKVSKTYEWRLRQLAAGIVEVRCSATAGALEDRYLDENMDELLEMKPDNARFDDYRTLIGLIR